MKESKQLIDQALEGIRPERTPIFDLLCNDAVIEHFAGRPFDGVSDRETAILAASHALDGTRYLGTPDVEGSTRVDSMGNVIESSRWTSWIKEYALQGLDAWVPWIEHNIQELESMPAPSADEIAQTRREQLELNEQLGGALFIHSTPSTSVNTAMFGYSCRLEVFSYLWFDFRDLVKRWMQAIERQELRTLQKTASAESSSLAMIYSDVAYKGRLMFSQEMFCELGFLDNVARICDVCHQKGLKVIFHSDGYVMDIMADLVAAGIDGFNPIEKAAGMDVFELRRLYPELILVGSVDVTHLLPYGSVEDVRRETRRIIENVGSEGHLLIGSTPELENNVPLENYLAFHDEVMAG